MTLVLSLVACSFFSDPSPPSGGGGGGGASIGAPPPNPAKAKGKAKGKGRRPRRAERDPQAKIPARGTFDPLEGVTKREWCHEEVLMLLKFPVEDLESSKGPRQDCCDTFPDLREQCEMDWPWNDVPSCEEWAWYRNAILARYGYPFDEAQWKKEFGNEPYYTRRDDFETSWMTAEAKRNTEKIANYETMEYHCQK